MRVLITDPDCTPSGKNVPAFRLSAFFSYCKSSREVDDSARVRVEVCACVSSEAVLQSCGGGVGTFSKALGQSACENLSSPLPSVERERGSHTAPEPGEHHRAFFFLFLLRTFRWCRITFSMRVFFFLLPKKYSRHDPLRERGMYDVSASILAVESMSGRHNTFW